MEELSGVFVIPYTVSV